MQLIPIHTRVVRAGDDLATILCGSATIESGDIVVVSSKVVATAEGSIVVLADLQVSDEAKAFSDSCGRSRAFCEAVIRETARMHGTIVGSCPGAMLTEVKPEGMRRGVILTANAGLDESNVAEGLAVGWPRDAAESATMLRRTVEEKMERGETGETGEAGGIAVIISDSCCRPRRWGVTAFALAVSGMQPLSSQAGVPDIFGKPLRITVEAVADQLATAANFLMGNAGHMTPACIIRDHGLPMSDDEGWVDGIEPEEDLFRSVIANGEPVT